MPQKCRGKSWMFLGYSRTEAFMSNSYRGNMKTQLLTALSIAGVLGTSTAALAANTEIFSGPADTNIGNAADVLLPVTDSTANPQGATPAPTVVTQPGTAPTQASNPDEISQVTGTRGDGQGYLNDNPAPVDPAVNPPAGNVQPPHGTTGGSGARANPDDDETDSDDQQEVDHERDEHQDEDDD